MSASGKPVKKRNAFAGSNDTGDEEWLSEGPFTDDDMFSSQDYEMASSQGEGSNLETLNESSQDAETVENISHQLQLEISFNNRTPVIKQSMVSSETTPAKVSKQSKKAPETPSAPAAANPQDMDSERLLDELGTFLIRKTDGKVLERKNDVQSSLNELVKETVGDDDEDAAGNNTDDLLSVLDEKPRQLRKRTRAEAAASATKVIKTDTKPTLTSSDAHKKLLQTAESGHLIIKKVKPTQHQTKQQLANRPVSNAAKNNVNKQETDTKPVILSNKVIHKAKTYKSNKNKKTSYFQLGKEDINNTKILPSQNSYPNDNLTINKTTSSPRQYGPKLCMSESFGDTYSEFIKKQTVIVNPKSTNESKNKIDAGKSKSDINKSASNVEKSQSNAEKSQTNAGKSQSPIVNKKDATTPKATFKLVSKQSPVVKSPSVSEKSAVVPDKINYKKIFEEKIKDAKTTKTFDKKGDILKQKEESPNVIGTIESRIVVQPATVINKSKSSPNTDRIMNITNKNRTQSTQSFYRKINTNPVKESNKFDDLIKGHKTGQNNLEKSQSNIEIKNKNVENLVKQNASALRNKYFESFDKISSIDKSKMNGSNKLNKKQELKNKKGSEEEFLDSEFEHYDEEMESDQGRPGRVSSKVADEADEEEEEDLEDYSDDEEHTDYEYDTDRSAFGDHSDSDIEDEAKWEYFSVDVRDERASDYLPLLGRNANMILTQEKRILLKKITSIKHTLGALYDNCKERSEEIHQAKLKLAELDTLLKMP